VAGVLSEYEVRRAAASGARFLYVEPGTIVSPSAVDAAEFLGLELRSGSPAPLAVPGIDHGRAMARTLYRRSPRWVAPASRRGMVPVRFHKVAFVGAGAVGTTTAQLAAAAGMAAELVLVDVVPGLAAAVALDIAHATGITGAAVAATGSTQVTDIAGADVVVVSAGRPRTPGMSRAALAEVNGRVIADVAAAVAAHAPRAVVVVVTNPVDEMTHRLWSASGLPEDRVIGMAGTLDSARFRYQLAAAAGAAPGDVEAITLGSHGEEMVPLVSSATIKGRPVREVLDAATLRRCVAETVNGGAAVVALRRTGSAFVAPARAVMEVLDALRGASAAPVPVSVRLRGQYGINGVFVGVPTRLNPQGVAEIVELALPAEELAALQAAAAAIAARA
jgi:malate dehydrogenase